MSQLITSTSSNLSATLQEKLQDTFGFEKFRPGQLEALITLLTEDRLLCIQPTGYGKSLLYQLPALLLEGMTLVVSPLLALMRDQLTQLKQRFGIATASINSDQSDDENLLARHSALTGSIRILFIAPEQLDHIDKFNFLINLPISLLVVDEAHCISTWGHDFRPSYRQIIKLVHALAKKKPHLKLLALTATANSKTEIDIKQQLMIDSQNITVIRESMDRPNIQLNVIKVNGLTNKLTILNQLLSQLTGTGLIYCATRENTELVADFLSLYGIKTIAYHAGLVSEQKYIIQNDFAQDKYKVIAATNALGMGIDKANIRYIIHFDFPGSITAYYQEVGRCGRDGLTARGILLYDPADAKIQHHFIESAQPSAKDFSWVQNLIAQSDHPPKLTTIKNLSGLHPTKVTVIIAELIEQGFLQKKSHNGSQVYVPHAKQSVPDLTRYVTQYEARKMELSNIQYYAEQSQKCLMLILREALGDQPGQACQHCSICAANQWQFAIEQTAIFQTATWLSQRTIPLTLKKTKYKNVIGLSILDGKLRSSLFIDFMRHRTDQNIELGIPQELMNLIKNYLHTLKKQFKFSCIIAIPSNTWKTRDKLVNLLATDLQVQALPNLLYWHKSPSKRQGELLNNDQRRDNVHLRMGIKLDAPLPTGAILLLDDYTGSGATLNEAARVLHHHPQITQPIIPFTIAAVKWRLGKSGMI